MRVPSLFSVSLILSIDSKERNVLISHPPRVIISRSLVNDLDHTGYIVTFSCLLDKDNEGMHVRIVTSSVSGGPSRPDHFAPRLPMSLEACQQSWRKQDMTRRRLDLLLTSEPIPG